MILVPEAHVGLNTLNFNEFQSLQRPRPREPDAKIWAEANVDCLRSLRGRAVWRLAEPELIRSAKLERRPSVHSNFEFWDPTPRPLRKVPRLSPLRLEQDRSLLGFS